LDFRIIATLLLILMTALPASAEISGVAVVNDGNVAWAAAGALGGTLSADQTANTNYGTSASQDVEATGTQAFASTGAINSEGYAATNVAVVQDGTLLGYQSSSTSEDAVSTDQGITVQGESGYVEATVSDPQGGSGSTVAEMENGELATAQSASDYQGYVRSGQYISSLSADEGRAESVTVSSEGTSASATAEVENGEIRNTFQETFASEGSSGTRQNAHVDGDYGSAGTSASDSQGNSISASAEVTDGELKVRNQLSSTEQGNFDASQTARIEGESGTATTEASGSDGGHVSVESGMEEGVLDTTQEASLSQESGSASQDTQISAGSGYARSEAVDSKGNTASAYVLASTSTSSPATIDSQQSARECDDSQGLFISNKMLYNNEWRRSLGFGVRDGAFVTQSSTASGSVVSSGISSRGSNGDSTSAGANVVDGTIAFEGVSAGNSEFSGTSVTFNPSGSSGSVAQEAENRGGNTVDSVANFFDGGISTVSILKSDSDSAGLLSRTSNAGASSAAVTATATPSSGTSIQRSAVVNDFVDHYFVIDGSGVTAWQYPNI